MTQIEQIKAEIERLKAEIPYHENAWSVLDKLKTFINSLPAEQASEDLEKAAKKYAVAKHHDKTLQDIVAIDFIAGANWQKEQMMKGFCYETKVYRDEEGDGIDTPIESWLALENNEITNLPNIGLKEGDKVKILIVKEDEQC